ncbi:hypothetical protein SDC9_210961 [bioreactor metagenome]|uniref:Uncharacterized protein n=1 Tax=bioreactor metagenome TaxID=1076179 RepID=A0A645JIE4_9ZZZZ
MHRISNFTGVLCKHCLFDIVGKVRVGNVGVERIGIGVVQQLAFLGRNNKVAGVTKAERRNLLAQFIQREV